MKCYIDRIEDGEYAVIKIQGGGEMVIPARQFRFKIHEGMHLTVDFRPDEKSESATLERIKKLQQELLKRSQSKHNGQKNDL